MLTLSLKNKQEGFSLLELSIALFILTILISLSMPRMTTLFQSPLEKETRRLATLLTDLKNQAILKRENYKIVFKFHDGYYRVYTQDRQNIEHYYPHDQYPEPIQLFTPVKFQDIRPNQPDDLQSTFDFAPIAFDKIFGQDFNIKIASDGLIDPFKIHFKTAEKTRSLTVKNVLGELEIGHEKPL